MSRDPESAAAREALLAAVRTAIAVPDGETPVILIDGPSGAGKSTLADLLVAEWPGPAAPTLVRMDDLYPGWDGLDAASEAVAAELLEPLARTGEGRWRRWDWADDRPAEWHPVVGPAPVIVEGCGTLSRVGVAHARLAIWADADDALRKSRALARDGETFAVHWEQWQGEFERYVAREHPRDNATLRVDVTAWPLEGPRERHDGTTVVV
ncbi:ATP-binding protein [Leifsonia sp. NPDC080035]|uniref:ATP-binding protein n=1 Tax=Leifsonia sp. NPDC080035 TaxID=3143936 RepID=A0AAU7G8Q1_9MICO